MLTTGLIVVYIVSTSDLSVTTVTLGPLGNTWYYQSFLFLQLWWYTIFALLNC